MSVWFNCKKCGEALAAAENKSGSLIACPKCKSKIKIPGIAMQNQATQEQIEYMQTILNRHRRSFVIYFTLLIIMVIISLTALKGAAILIWIGYFYVGAFMLLLSMINSRKVLGIYNGIEILLLLFLGPIWWILCIASYIRLKKRIAYLKNAGFRNNDT